MRRRAVFALALAIAASSAPLRAERQIVDLHRLDAYFALFAADSNVPWKSTTVRLDTYSSAPVHFSVYQVDPDDVLTAGSNARPRAVATSRLHPAVAFDFTPPGGYQFQSNDVDTRLGSREGFFIVEARRGDVGEQVWINRTRVGLISKETPRELLLYGADLGTGKAIGAMRVQFVVGRHFVTQTTDARGIVRWSRTPRPVFALAQWANSYAFLSLLPQAPLPATIVGVRTESAVVHAGGMVRIVGFARTRTGNTLRAASGSASISIRSGAATIGERRVPLDAAGAFSTSFAIPSTAQSGDYAALAQVDGSVGGASVHVDGNAGGVSLEVTPRCGVVCDAQSDVPILVRSSRGGVAVHVTVVRSPHVYGETPADAAAWATTVWLDRSVRTGSDGTANVSIPHPSDELASTYGVHVESGGATADTRVVVPTARAAIAVRLDRDEQTLETPIGFDVWANEVATGKPLSGATVTMRLVHGSSVAQQQLTLDRDGRARGSFSSLQLGTNLVFASIDDGGRATDARAVQVDAHAADAPALDRGSENVRLWLDKPGYRGGDGVTVQAQAPGSAGDALITLESGLGTSAQLAGVNAGGASARLRAGESAGEVRVGGAFVRDGAMEWATQPLKLQAPGRPESTSLNVDPGTLLAPGQSASVSLHGVSGGLGTLIVRVSRGDPTGSAVFDSAPSLLAVGAVTTQTSAPAATTWHPWVDSTGNHAAVLGFVRRTRPPAPIVLAQGETETVWWNVARGNGTIAVPMPSQSGRYTVSLLNIADDGSVSAGSSEVLVR